MKQDSVSLTVHRSEHFAFYENQIASVLTNHDLYVCRNVAWLWNFHLMDLIVISYAWL